MPDTPTESDRVMKAWNSWMGTLGTSLIDGGNPSGLARTIAANGKVSDGGGANPLTGYSIIEAKDLDDAVRLSKGCPILLSGGSIEVSELIAI
jgi:hypothetical protein